jgi:ribosome biogenesis GTPase
MPRGLVVGVSGPLFSVDVGGKETLCILRGRLKREKQNVTSLVVIGDEVEVALPPGGTGVIEEIAPRRTELARPGFKGRTRVLAANLDQLVIVQATRQPVFKRHFVERFLALASRGGMRALVVLNKIDLEPPDLVARHADELRAAGVPVVLTAAKEGRGIDDLKSALLGRSSAMVGPSGVGKSRLLNAIDPTVKARVGDISEVHQKGRHTTTASRLYPLPGGGYLADTPGIRELALFEEDQQSIDAIFPEIEQAAAACRFRGCSHSHEPECAVKQAVERGEIAADRYRHFLRLIAGD